jgi:anaerobic magnesium-protoporphyrin IX monomethyl ester cyclase
MRYVKAIVVNPPNPQGYVSNKDSMGGFGQLYPKGATPFPPLDIPYLAAFLMERQLEVDVIEAGALDLSTADVCRHLQADPGASSALVVVRTSLPTVDWDLQICRQMKHECALGAVALFGAAVPSLLRRIEADDAIDYAILGEPDATVAELMIGHQPEQIPGLLYRKAGGWAQTATRPFERDLDSLPFPRWELLPYDRYVIPKSSTSGHLRFLPMLTSRGCPYGCSYCPYPVGQGLKWRFRSPRNVVDEMEHLVRDFGVEHILFRDPMFSIQQTRVVEICEELLRRGLKVQWKCETRVDCLDEATIEIMARAGCTGINFGVESTDPKIQQGVHRKPILKPEFVEKVGICRKNHIATFAFFVVGLPGDTVDTILSSIEFAVDIRANWTQFTVATPFAGTPMHEWAVRQGFIAPDFYKIISAHDGSPGNEHLRPRDIVRLYRFARFLQNNLINRRGILKNETRRDLPYRLAQRATDVVAYAAAAVVVRAGRQYFTRTITQLPSELSSTTA